VGLHHFRDPKHHTVPYGTYKTNRRSQNHASDLQQYHEFEQEPAVRIAASSADAGHDHSQRYVVYDFSLSTGAWLFYGELVVGHVLAIVGIGITAMTFHNASKKNPNSAPVIN